MIGEMTLEELAGEAAAWFETGKREGRDEHVDAYFVRLKEGAPEWLRDLVHDAHGDLLPDDWRYSCIRSALDSIADGNDDAGEFADSEADVYNAPLTAWLSSNLSRGGYVDEAIEEFGYPGDRGIFGAIAMGQYMEATEVFGSVYASLESRLESLEEEEEEGDAE